MFLYPLHYLHTREKLLYSQFLEVVYIHSLLNGLFSIKFPFVLVFKNNRRSTSSCSDGLWIMNCSCTVANNDLYYSLIACIHSIESGPHVLSLNMNFDQNCEFRYSGLYFMFRSFSSPYIFSSSDFLCKFSSFSRDDVQVNIYFLAQLTFEFFLCKVAFFLPSFTIIYLISCVPLF